MGFKKLDNRTVNNARRFEFPELERNKLRNIEFSVGKSLEPAFKFSEVVFVYRLTDKERRQLNVQFDNPGVIAIIA